jgi:hypothetical protein
MTLATYVTIYVDMTWFITCVLDANNLALDVGTHPKGLSITS